MSGIFAYIQRLSDAFDFLLYIIIINIRKTTKLQAYFLRMNVYKQMG